MAIPSTSLHTRSISLPSTSHPIDVSIEDCLRRLRSSLVGPSSSSICGTLSGIKDLYEHMNDLISLPHNQTPLCRGDADEGLEGSLALFDASSSALDVVSQMKESILDLQSCLRRGNGKEGIHAYLVSRKKINKIASKGLAYLKKADKNSTSLESDAIMMRMLKEAEAISLSTLKSILSFVMGKKTISQTRSWSVIAKLVKFKPASTESDETSAVEEVDYCALSSLTENQLGGQTKVLMKLLEELEMVLHELEDGLESVSRCLVKTRVSLLNVLNHY